MRDDKNLQRRARRPASIDGIITDGRRLGVPSGKNKPSHDKPAPSIDNFIMRGEGFYPLRQASGGGLGEAVTTQEYELLDEPIILDEERTSEKVGKRDKGRKFLKRTSLGILSLAIIGGAYLGVKFLIAERHILRGGGKAPALAQNVDINQLRGEGDGRINVLLLGIGGPGHDGPDLTDTVLLASIDPINNNMVLLSLPRDLWSKIPNDGSQKLNAAYAFGKQRSDAKNEADKKREGIDLLDKTLENEIGIPIHYHVLVDFAAFQQAINAVGGVDANVPKELTAHEVFWVEGTNQHYTLNVTTGQQHFDGTKALYFARERHNDSDFVRSQRQRLMLVALKDKIFSAGTFANPVKINQLLSSFGDNVYTDFSLSEISRLNDIIKNIPSSGISSLDLVTPPHDFLTTGSLSGLSIVQPKAGLYDYSDVQNYIRNSLRDGFIAKENAQIAIYNATSVAGMATSNAKKLKSFGYNVTMVDNTPASSNPEHTTIVDLSKGVDKYTRHYLEERFGVISTGSVPPSFGINPPSGTSFVIILGKDAQNSS